MKIATVIGARPQFIKAAAVSRVLRTQHQEILIHTGQHYDANMSEIFFEELHIPRPDYNLGIGSGRHGAQTGAILEQVEEVLITENPDALLVYGDTNSTLAGALAASKLHIPVIHIEAGLRSFNRRMPEEINRVLTDHLSSWLFCPTETAVKNLTAEGITAGVYKNGDVMNDAFLYNLELAKEKSNILQTLGLTSKSFILCTIHRAENTDDPTRLTQILKAVSQISQPVVLPLHPRTRKIVQELGLNSLLEQVKVIEPVGYLDMITLEAHALKLVTDSGGVQKEAYFAGVPCITMRDETEWVETVEVGWNRLTGADEGKILDAVESFTPPDDRPSIFGDGHAAEQFVTALER
ncbi:UDP-N-acetylglucosamine 2-epimerase (non-hydrolyzing) [Desulfosporosinus fructosivorans]|uniref:UDP-N-acetylglucosamine 2-epimerase (Non-hydrolyzing) n=1 Tax=Desulfosporosinus fructosivorans TaxID=2018669 RepID=A0A4Z0RDB0_9FIRM|nr:UDP-N-acetylglucosamine 2-epimerase (non-hydrolyzing) [Desulfosporosinus fructosivorans]TGE39546.1 UDP-N-acetylglucosamine 2-epimerase (non-hydrolyzing) [Desulfosporosinus fructosivorans]